MREESDDDRTVGASAKPARRARHVVATLGRTDDDLVTVRRRRRHRRVVGQDDDDRDKVADLPFERVDVRKVVGARVDREASRVRVDDVTKIEGGEQRVASGVDGEQRFVRIGKASRPRRDVDVDELRQRFTVDVVSATGQVACLVVPPKRSLAFDKQVEPEVGKEDVPRRSASTLRHFAPMQRQRRTSLCRIPGVTTAVAVVPERTGFRAGRRGRRRDENFASLRVRRRRRNMEERGRRAHKGFGFDHLMRGRRRMSASATTAPTTARTAQTSLSRLDKLGSTKEKRERIGLSVKGGEGGRRETARDAQGEERLLESALRATVRATDGVATVDAGGAELDDGVVEDGRRDAGREVVQVEVRETG